MPSTFRYQLSDMTGGYRVAADELLKLVKLVKAMEIEILKTSRIRGYMTPQQAFEMSQEIRKGKRRIRSIGSRFMKYK